MMRCDPVPGRGCCGVAWRRGAAGALDLFLEQRGAPMRRWCLACWVAAFRVPVDEAAA